MAKEKYKWTFCTIGGVTRVNIVSGADIAHLDQLDQKLWTVLSCPTGHLEFDAKTLSMLDLDADGVIHVNEVIQSSKWVTSLLKDPDFLIKESDNVPLEMIDASTLEGERLVNCAKRILKNAGLEKESISIEDADNSIDVFSKTRFNGDGVITADVTEDESIKKAIVSTIAAEGSVEDRSGVQGVNEEIVKGFAADCEDYVRWMDDASARRDEVFPFGDDTEAVLSVCEELKGKVEDFFMRCSLSAFNPESAGVLDVSADRIGAISAKNLSECYNEIAEYPLAMVNGEKAVPYDAVNPVWQETFGKLRKLVLENNFPDSKSMNEAQWRAINSLLEPYRTWKGAAKGEKVASIGIDYAREFIANNYKERLLELIAEDKKSEDEYNDLNSVDRFVHLCRWLYKFLRNYVAFSDFYDRSKSAMFQVGKLYIDERCCELCIRMEDGANQADMSSLSGMFILYCKCTSKVDGKVINIAAPVTAGDIKSLRPGKNGIFYDLDGNVWDATVTSITDNPISIRQAFFAPYRKVAKFVEETVNKAASEKDAKMVDTLKADVVAAPAAAGEKKPPFDIAKFAGIFAALGMAVAALGAAFAGILAFAAKLHWWQLILLVAIIMLLISFPSMVMAWIKLKKRNLAPILNANGWAVNAMAKINIPFGRTLTSMARYPKIKMKDPYTTQAPLWRRLLYWLVMILTVGYFVCSFIPYTREKMGRWAFRPEKIGEKLDAAIDDAAQMAAESVSDVAEADSVSALQTPATQ